MLNIYICFSLIFFKHVCWESISGNFLQNPARDKHVNRGISTSCLGVDTDLGYTTAKQIWNAALSDHRGGLFHEGIGNDTSLEIMLLVLFKNMEGLLERLTLGLCKSWLCLGVQLEDSCKLNRLGLGQPKLKSYLGMKKQLSVLEVVREKYLTASWFKNSSGQLFIRASWILLLKCQMDL